MKNTILNILKKYLLIFPEEKLRQEKFVEFLNKYNDDCITDWNNFDGHIVASGFVYAEKDHKFLVLYHNDLKTYLYPGGHIDNNDINPLDTAKREIEEETGLMNLKQIIIGNDKLIPIDIDTHIIEYNKRLNLPQHYHFDFRYLFIIDKIEDVKIDVDELSNYKWIDINEFKNNLNCNIVTSKIELLLNDKIQ